VSKLKRDDLIQPDLSYEIVGACFDVFKEIGGQHKERYLQKALMVAFGKRDLKFKREVSIPLKYQEVVVGKYILDFIVEDTVVVEIKSSGQFKTSDFEQIKQYLANTKTELGLLIRFSEKGVTYQRILKPKIINVDQKLS
jgi:GxxExxY protein